MTLADLTIGRAESRVAEDVLLGWLSKQGAGRRISIDDAMWYLYEFHKKPLQRASNG